MEKIKRMISWVLILCLSLAYVQHINLPSFADKEDQDTITENTYTTYQSYIESTYTESQRLSFKSFIDNAFEYKGRNEADLTGTLYDSDITEKQILYYLINYQGVRKKSDDSSLYLNPHVYRKYKIVAYDTLSVIEVGQRGHGSVETVNAVAGVETEYRYLGYTADGEPITNDFYPADFISGTPVNQKTYKSTSEATASWSKFNENDHHYGQLYQIMNTNILNDDVTDGVYRNIEMTTLDVLRLTGFPSYSDNYSSYMSNSTVKNAQSKIVMMQYPSLGSIGQFKLIHGTNRQYYDTFRTQHMTLSATVSIKPKRSVYFIEDGQETVTINYDVETVIDDAKTTLPYNDGLNISKVNLKSEGKNLNVFDNPDTINKTLANTLSGTYSKTISVKNLDLTDGMDEVALNATSEYTDMTDYTVSFEAPAVKVKVCASSDFVADFTIHDKDGEDVTDGMIIVPDMIFTTPSEVTLKDASVTEKGNIISRKWYVLDGTEYKPISSLNETQVSYTVTAANRSSVIHGNKLSFMLEIKTDLSEDTEIAIHEVIFGQEITAPSGPVAIISAKLDQNSNDDYVTMEGDVFDINGRESYHPEGLKLTKFQFATNGGAVSSTGGKKNDYIYYLESGKYYPELTVTDENDGQDKDSTTIIVRSAEFIPEITVDGTLKENRRVSISVKNKKTLKYFPIETSSLDWTITPLDGQGDVIRTVGSADGSQYFNALFKKKGRYRIDVTGNIYNGYKRYSGSATTTITIAEDIAPVADFTVSSKHVRDVSFRNLTQIIIYDNSHSLDNDYITQRKYWYRYDDDNDGDFTDTDWILLSASNYTKMNLWADQVGKYQFKVEVKEGFGQPTISTFITDSDYKRGNTDAKADADKMTEMINIAPTVNLDIANKKPVHLIVYHDYDAPALTNFKNQVEILKAKLLGKQMELSVDYLTPTEVVGDREVWTTYFDTYISVNIGVVGEGSDYDNRSGDSDDWDICETQTLNLYLDSFYSEGNEDDLSKTMEGRFEIVDVSFQGYNYVKLGTSKDYSEFAWRDLVIQYKDKGVLKSRTYKFVYDWREYYSGSYMKTDEFEYTTYDIKGSNLNVDMAYQSRPAYINTNYTFVKGSDPAQYISLPTDTKRTVELKTYYKSHLDGIVEETTGHDAYFLNLCSEESNRLGLNQELKQTLEDQNIHYLTLEGNLLKINPLGGRYDDILLGNRIGLFFNGKTDKYEEYRNQLIITLGKLAYELDMENLRYKFVGAASKCADQFKETFDNKYVKTDYSMYTLGYSTYDGSWKGLKALDMYLGYHDYDQYIYYKSSSLSDAQATWNSVVNNAKTPFEYSPGTPIVFTVEADGSLVGYKYRLEFEESSKYYIRVYKSAYVADTGYSGVLNFTAKTNDNVTIKGYIKDKIIYFKAPSSYTRYGISWTNYLTVTEGTDNIEDMYYASTQNKLYVYTETSVILYDFNTRTRKVLTNEVIERKGTSVRIGDNKWMIGEVVYDGYKEIYTNDIDGSAIQVSYLYHDRVQGVPATHEMKVYIDENDDYYIERTYYCKYLSYTVDFHTKDLIASNVKALPLMGGLSKLPNPIVVSGSLTAGLNAWAPHDISEYLYCNSYIAEDGYLYSSSGQKFFDAPVRRISNARRVDGYDWVGQGATFYSSLISLENGVIGTNVNDKPTYIAPIQYANLTVGNKGDVVGDNELIGVSSLSKAYANLNDIMDGIYNDYANYSGTNDVYVLLGDNIEVTMLYDDYESDEAYSMVYDFEHTNPNYFENSLGKDPLAGTGLSKPLTTLNYVGHYEVRPKVKDNPKDDDRFDEYRLENEDEALVNVYVHRRPIALMNFKFADNISNPTYMTLTCKDNGSYDLDHEHAEGKGIVNYEFAIKSENDFTWTKVEEKSFTHLQIERGVEYKIVYRVQDVEGAWSLPLEKTFKIDEVPINLTAKVKSKDTRFSVDAMPITEYYQLYDIETEYPTELKLEIGLYDSDVQKGPLMAVAFDEGVSGVKDADNPNLVRWQLQNLQVPETLPDKAYQIKVRAVDVANPLKSEELVLDVGVRTPINPVPTLDEVFIGGESVDISCTSSIYTNTLDMTLYKGTDEEETVSMVFEKWLYEDIDGVQKKVGKMWSYSHTTASEMKEGVYDIVFTGTVNTTPKKTESVLRRVHVIPLNFESVTITGAWQHWRGQEDLFGEQMADMPYRFLSWEKIYITAKTIGDPDSVFVRMSEPLEAMSFTDQNGVTYDYEDDFGDEVDFPLKLKNQGNDIWSVEYILPLAPSTLSWDDERLRPSYEVVVTAKKNDTTIDYVFSESNGNGIEITGNTTDLIYVQPLPDRR